MRDAWLKLGCSLDASFLPTTRSGEGVRLRVTVENHLAVAGREV